MQKKSIFWLTLLLSALLPLIAGCSTNISPAGTGKQNSNQPIVSSEHLYVLDGYTPLGSASARQQIVALQPSDNNSKALVTLPAGLTSLDHQRLYATTAQSGQTAITVFNTRTGATLRSFSIPDTYSTAGENYTTATLSANGQWLALRQIGSQADQTTIALVDTEASKLVKTIHLKGEFEMDTISPDGYNLYLLEQLNDHSGHYNVRLYQVALNQLYEYPIIDKTIPNDIMSGIGLTRQMSPDGSTAYTLYIDTVHNIAFVHMLSMNGENFPLARCIDLPVGKSADLLHYYTLTLSSDGSTLYAANGALGVVTELHAASGNNIWDGKVTATSHFNPGEVSLTSSDKTRMLYNGAALSPDGKVLYFAGTQGIWAMNTLDIDNSRSNVQGNYLTQSAFTGIALSANGQTLYAVDPAHGIMVLNITTKQSQQLAQSAAQTPWGIVWIMQ